MRKKIVSTLLALCMVLSLLPITVFAAELTDAQKADLKAQGYTDEQIENVLIIEEDTEIDADEDRLIVIVTPGVTVTVKGATLSVGVVVAPGAADSKVVVAAESNVNAIVVLDKAEVVLEENAKATYVTIAAAEASVTVSGEAEKVTVGESAEKATVTVTNGATVETVTVAAPEAATEIAGTVETVTVAETATGASTTVASTGSVTDVEIAAPAAETTVAGTVTNVAVTETAEGAATTVAASGSVTSVTVDAPKTTITANGTVENVTVGEAATETTINGEPSNVTDESSNVIDTNAPVENPGEDTTAGVDADVDPYVKPETMAQKTGKGIIAAPLDDHGINMGGNVVTANKGRNDTIANTTGNGADLANGLASYYNVNVVKDNTKENTTYDVTVVAKDVIAHGNTSNQGACWVGISIPVDSGYNYSYYYVTTNAETGATIETKVDNINAWTDDNGQAYETFYWGFAGGSKDTVASKADTDVDKPWKTLRIKIDEIEKNEGGTNKEADGKPVLVPGTTEVVDVNLELKIDRAEYGKDENGENGKIVWSNEELEQFKTENPTMCLAE